MNISTFTVLPDTPEKLKALNDLAYNMYFAWHHEARRLFMRLDTECWYKSQQNPVRFLSIVPQEVLDAKARDSIYLTEVEQVAARFRNYLNEKTWFEREHGKREQPVVAYFSCEYGLHECLPVYSGGLGVLSGDHIKSASDMGIPVVAVGLLYRQGYFTQQINAEGMQQESYPENDWYSMPVHQVRDPDGRPVTCSIKLDGDEVHINIWRVDVGRVCIYLLDTNIPENSEPNRRITVRLYDPDRDTRLRQEMVLGIGGVAALHKLGYDPAVYHVNEGHSAFLILERARRLMKEQGLSFAEARELIWATTVFTTHTPVPAGNERFHPDLLRRYFHHYIGELGLSWEDFLALGREDVNNPHEEFCLTVLAIRFAAFVNGVSALHGQVTRQMWQRLFPGIPSEEIPIGHVTNGVHTQTWINRQLLNLFARHMGTGAFESLADFTLWDNLDAVPDDELWEVHEHNRRHLIEVIRLRRRLSLEQRGAGGSEIDAVRRLLDPHVLTIGFARRFATYKRGYLLLKDEARLARLLSNPQRPVQIVIAGKAHPADHGGKDIIRRLIDFAVRHGVSHRLVFIENYDMYVARRLVQGVDVWLNTPRRPLEASGTSGMKAALNGVINCSILDGWWDEAYNRDIGWAIGHHEVYENPDVQDNIESGLLFHLLEQEVVPTFYERDEHNLPKRWVYMMRASMKAVGNQFNANRMLREYTEKYYLRGEELYQRFTRNKFKALRELAAWRQKLAAEWPHVEIVKVESPVREFVNKGDTVQIRATVRLSGLKPENLVVQVYHGPVASQNRIEPAQKTLMEPVGSPERGLQAYQASIPCAFGGRYGYTVRLLPGHDDLAEQMLPNCVKWA